MLKTKENTGKVSIPIIIILLVIIIFGAILALKVTGVIEPKEPQITSNTITNETVIGSNNNSNTVNFYENIAETASFMATIFSIASLIITIGLNIGTCKLYQKLGLSHNIVMFNFLYPILTIIANWFSGIIQTIFSLVAGILGIITLVQYFKAVGMSGFWGVLPFLAIIMLSIGTTALIVGGGSFIALVALIMLVSSLIAYVISNIKLGKIFDKSTAFTVGLVLLPFIFQPILGYGNSERTL